MSPAEIKSIRDELGWTQERFASAVGVEKAAVSHWEKGIRQPSGAAEILINQLRELALRNPKKK